MRHERQDRPRATGGTVGAANPSGLSPHRMARGFRAGGIAADACADEPAGAAAWRDARDASGYRDGLCRVLYRRSGAGADGADAVAQFVNVSEYFKRRATSLGIKTQELIKSPEQMQQEAQQAQQAAMMQAAIPNGVNAISDQISNAQEGANMNQQISE